MAKFSFKRVEKKYIVTKSQRDELLKELGQTITNTTFIYY